MAIEWDVSDQPTGTAGVLVRLISGHDQVNSAEDRYLTWDSLGHLVEIDNNDDGDSTGIASLWHVSNPPVGTAGVDVSLGRFGDPCDELSSSSTFLFTQELVLSFDSLGHLVKVSVCGEVRWDANDAPLDRAGVVVELSGRATLSSGVSSSTENEVVQRLLEFDSLGHLQIVQTLGDQLIACPSPAYVVVPEDVECTPSSSSGAEFDDCPGSVPGDPGAPAVPPIPHELLVLVLNFGGGIDNCTGLSGLRYSSLLTTKTGANTWSRPTNPDGITAVIVTGSSVPHTAGYVKKYIESITVTGGGSVAKWVRSGEDLAVDAGATTCPTTPAAPCPTVSRYFVPLLVKTTTAAGSVITATFDEFETPAAPPAPCLPAAGLPIDAPHGDDLNLSADLVFASGFAVVDGYFLGSEWISSDVLLNANYSYKYRMFLTSGSTSYGADLWVPVTQTTLSPSFQYVCAEQAYKMRCVGRTRTPIDPLDGDEWSLQLPADDAYFGAGWVSIGGARHRTLGVKSCVGCPIVARCYQNLAFS